MEHKIRLGTAVKRARQTLGLTQFELAERAGVSLRTITDEGVKFSVSMGKILL